MLIPHVLVRTRCVALKRIVSYLIMYFILGKKDEMLMTFSDTKDKRGKKRRHMSIGKDRQREGTFCAHWMSMIFYLKNVPSQLD